jgi:methylphosphotriester-DNA--protein-cysteine methyltransferase
MPHRVFFADEATAIAAGYRPCGACMRREYAAWKAARDLAGPPGGSARRQ